MRKLAFLATFLCFACFRICTAADSVVVVETTWLFVIPCTQFDLGKDEEQSTCCAVVDDSTILVQMGDHRLVYYSLKGDSMKSVVHDAPHPATYLRYDRATNTISYLAIDRDCRDRKIHLLQLDTNGSILKRSTYRASQLSRALVRGGFIEERYVPALRATFRYSDYVNKKCSSMARDPLYNYLCTLGNDYVLLGRVWPQACSDSVRSQHILYEGYDLKHKSKVCIKEYTKGGFAEQYYWNQCEDYPYDSKSGRQSMSVFEHGREAIVLQQQAWRMVVMRYVIR